MTLLQNLRANEQILLDEIEPLQTRLYTLQAQIAEEKAKEVGESGLLSQGTWVLYINGTHVGLYADKDDLPLELSTYFDWVHDSIDLNDLFNTAVRFNDNEFFVHSDDIIGTINLYNLEVDASRVNADKEQLEKTLASIKTITERLA